MDFITQFENTLAHTLNQNLLTQSEQLLSTFRTTNLPYTVPILACINRLRQKKMTPLKRIVLYKTGNFILDYIAGQFACFFSGKGCDTFFFDPTDFSASSEQLFAFAREGIDRVYCFNNVGLLQSFADGQNLWEALSVPCYDFLVDHPMYYADSLDYAPADTTVLCADATHADYVKRFYPAVKNALFMPTGGQAPALPFEELPKWQTRPIDVLFIGSYKCNFEKQKDDADRFVDSYLTKHTDCPFEKALEIYHQNKADGVSDSADSLKASIEVHRFSETNLTAAYRKAIMEDLLTAGITIHVYGEGWDQTDLPSDPHFILHKPVSFEEGIQLMSQSKIVLNHMAWFKHGSGERIFNAMSQGAVCVTDSSQYLDTILTDGENCFLFPLSEIGQHIVSEKIKHILSRPEAAARVIENGYLCAKEHTWQSHLSDLMEDDFK